MQTPDNFGGLPERYSNYEKSGIVILPVPFDKTSTWQHGAELGPEKIIEAAQNMELFDIETGSEIYHEGIHTDAPIVAETSAEMVAAVQTRVGQHLQAGKFVVTLGGEHTVSLGAIQAHLKKFGNISILQLDAHTDLRDIYEGSKLSHACVMARVRELTDEVVAVGIRSMDESEGERLEEERTTFAHEMQTSGWIKRVVRELSDQVYITLDLDVFDPSIMPSTGTPEPGGMDWYQMMRLLEAVTEVKKIVGFDVVELCPNEHNRAPDFLAAKLIYRILSMRFGR
ncbi:MAG: agmatinase [bacterium]